MSVLNDPFRIGMLETLYRYVEAMRREQRAYFAGDYSALGRAKDWERQADKLIKEIAALDAGHFQPALMGTSHE